MKDRKYELKTQGLFIKKMGTSMAAQHCCTQEADAA